MVISHGRHGARDIRAGLESGGTLLAYTVHHHTFLPNLPVLQSIQGPVMVFPPPGKSEEPVVNFHLRYMSVSAGAE